MLTFETMLTPKLITVVYWILLLVAAVTGIGMVFSGSLLNGLLVAVGGALGARIWCELMIVMFKMNEALQVIKNK